MLKQLFACACLWCRFLIFTCRFVCCTWCPSTARPLMPCLQDDDDEDSKRQEEARKTPQTEDRVSGGLSRNVVERLYPTKWQRFVMSWLTSSIWDALRNKPSKIHQQNTTVRGGGCPCGPFFCKIRCEGGCMVKHDIQGGAPQLYLSWHIYNSNRLGLW